MRYFIDTEFLEDGKTIELISIAVVRSDGLEYYACNAEFDESRATDWLREHVLPQLPPRNQAYWKTRKQIADDLQNAIVRSSDKDVEFWGYFADYDWVVLCQLFGRMIDLPSHFPMFCMDAKQEMRRRRLKKDQLPPQLGKEHSALEDARWVRDCVETLEAPWRHHE